MAEQQNRWSLVCINPALVMGPLTDASQSGSIEVLQQFGNGTTLFGVPPMWNGIVDVRDVADAHVAAAINPSKSRYIVCGGTLLTRNG
jgi:dihydroflavonol-4-reductase